MLDSRLRHLVAVARTGSFTAGAAVVGITQSAVTKSVADLEREIGYQLVTRNARGAVLTERGSYFAERAAILLDDARDLMDSRGGRRGDAYCGVLRIGVAPPSIEWCLVDAVVKLQHRHPAIRFEVAASSFDHMIQQLRSGAIDVGIGLDAALNHWADLRREPFGLLRALPFVRRDHPLTLKTDLSLGDLAAYDFMSPSESRPYGERIREVYSDHGVGWRDRVHVIDYFPAVKRLAAKSDAIGVVASQYAESRAFRDQFATLDSVPLFPVVAMSCAVRANWEPKPTTRAFIAMVKATAAMKTSEAKRESQSRAE